MGQKLEGIRKIVRVDVEKCERLPYPPRAPEANAVICARYAESNPRGCGKGARFSEGNVSITIFGYLTPE